MRLLHVGFTLVLTFLLFPVLKRFRHRLMPWDFVLAAAAVAVIGYALLGGDEFSERSITPTRLDAAMGIVLIALILEACRRSTGIVMPIIVTVFFLYAVLGDSLPQPWGHKGREIGEVAGRLYQTLEGIFGAAVDVSATLIILFTIYGAVLNVTGAGKFYIDFSFSAMGGRSSGAGRAIVASSFLLGGPSGSGVATTVTLGSVAYPMLASAGYGKNAAGGLLAAGGLGAILSPPVLGAAAFLIAEYLKISYRDVIVMAAIPTCLYYFSLLVMVEIDARKNAVSEAQGLKRERLRTLLRRGGYHFYSLIVIVAFMFLGLTPTLAVVWATVVAILATLFPSLIGLVATIAAGALAKYVAMPWSLLAALAMAAAGAAMFRQRDRITGRQLFAAMRDGSVGMLNVAATCAAAGIIVGVVTMTGLGLKFSAIIVDYAGGSVILTAIYSALIVWLIGLAVPVTASYIICAVIVAPALIKLGVPDFAAHMFIFYFAVLSEVSPPTALSPFAAAAITGGGPYATTMQAWKYTLPAFVVPFVFVIEPAGTGLLLSLPKGGAVWDIALVALQTAAGLAALAVAFQGWLIARLAIVESALLAVGGFCLMLPRIAGAILQKAIAVEPSDIARTGLAISAVVVAQHLARHRWLKRGDPHSS